MAHFHLGDGTRFYVKGNSGEEKITMHHKRSFKLKQEGAAEVFSDKPNVVKVLDGKKQVFTVQAGDTSDTATLKGKDKDGNEIKDMSLTVVVGDFKNHNGWKIDLLANVGRGSDPKRIHLLQRILHNNEDNLINQHRKAITDAYGDYACGTVCKQAAPEIFGMNIELPYRTYHEPLNHVKRQPDRDKCAEVTRDDVKYRKATIDRARAAIRRRLGEGKPVRVGTIYSPTDCTVMSGGLQPTEPGGHFVLIVGCNDDWTQFLYLDPWPEGSKWDYKGGIEKYEQCKYLGVFILKQRGDSPVLLQHDDAQAKFGGSSRLEVIAGPWM